MSILNTSLSLNQIEKELERQLEKPENNIRILGDMDFSYEDYQYLLLKIRGLGAYGRTLEILENCRLSILTLLVFGLRMEKGKRNCFMKLREEMDGLEQHRIRKYAQMMLEAFEEYGLNMFGIKTTGTMDDFLELLVVHTGIPEELQDDFCHLLDESLMYGEFSAIANRFLTRLPEHMKNLYSYVRREVVIQMIDYSRKMFQDYRLHGITRREAYAKYSVMSSNLMKGCFRWCETQEMYAKKFG